jgi:hypothetical protein
VTPEQAVKSLRATLVSIAEAKERARTERAVNYAALENEMASISEALMDLMGKFGGFPGSTTVDVNVVDYKLVFDWSNTELGDLYVVFTPGENVIYYQIRGQRFKTLSQFNVRTNAENAVIQIHEALRALIHEKLDAV